MRPPPIKPLIDPPFEAPPQLPEDEVATAEAENAKERVLSEIKAASHWGVVECLLWLGLRDHPQMAERLAPWQSMSGDATTDEVTLLRMTLRSLEISEGSSSDPAERLVALLRAGSLVATGRHSGTGARQEIPSEEWSDLTFSGGTGDFQDGAVATNRPGSVGAAFWSALSFERVAVEALDPSQKWRDVPPIPLKRWCTEPIVEDEAIRRRTRTSEAATCESLAVMYQEIVPKTRTTAGSIKVTRRRARSEIAG
jgi:hypothetical protein